MSSVPPTIPLVPVPTLPGTSGLNTSAIEDTFKGIDAPNIPIGQIIIFVLAMGFLFLIFLMVVVIPIKNNTVGLIPKYETGVVERLGDYKLNKTINPVDVNDRPLKKRWLRPGALGRIYWRLPWSKVTKVNRKRIEIALHDGNVIVAGTEINFGARGYVWAYRPDIFLSKINVDDYARSKEDGDKDDTPGFAIENAVRAVGHQILSTMMPLAMTRPGITADMVLNRDPGLDEDIEAHVNLAAQDVGLQFYRMHLAGVGVTDTLARDQASEPRALLSSRGVRVRFNEMTRPGGELEEYRDSLRRLYPHLSDAELMDKVEHYFIPVNAGTTGGGEMTYGNGGKQS